MNRKGTRCREEDVGQNIFVPHRVYHKNDKVQIKILNAKIHG